MSCKNNIWNCKDIKLCNERHGGRCLHACLVSANDQLSNLIKTLKQEQTVKLSHININTELIKGYNK